MSISLEVFEDFAKAKRWRPKSGTREIMILGYHVSGDGGGARYRRISKGAVHLVCADGSLWQIAEPEVTPLMFGAAPGDDTIDDTPSMEAAFKCAAQLGRGIYVPPGSYAIYSTVVVPPKPIPDPDYQYQKPGPTYRFDKQAMFKAMSPMTGMFSFGDGTWETIHRNSTLYGGVFDCNSLADVGLWIRFCNLFQVYDAEVRNFRVHGFRAGDKGAPQRSYEALFIGCKTTRDLVPAPQASTGIYFQNCGDSHALNCIIRGVRVGIGGDDVWDSKFTNVHVWNFRENGDILYGFDVDGDNVLTGCQVDGPFKYAYRFKNLRNSLNACNVNYTDEGYGGLANHATVILIERRGGVAAMNCNWKAQSETARLKAEVEGDKSNFISKGNKFINVINYDVAYGPNEPCMVGLIRGASHGGEIGLIRRGINIASVERLDTGDYLINTNNPIPDDGPLLVTARLGGGPEQLIAVEVAASRTPTAVRVQFYNNNDQRRDPHSFSILMFGALEPQ